MTDWHEHKTVRPHNYLEQECERLRRSNEALAIKYVIALCAAFGFGVLTVALLILGVTR